MSSKLMDYFNKQPRLGTLSTCQQGRKGQYSLFRVAIHGG